MVWGRVVSLPASRPGDLGRFGFLSCQVLAGFDTSGCGGEDLHPGEGLFLHYGLSGMRGHWGWGRGY